MSRSRRALLFCAVILVLAAGGYSLWRWPASLFGAPATPGRIIVSGNIEAHESVLSFTQVQAPIIDLPFDEGAHVAARTVLARVDDRLYQPAGRYRSRQRSRLPPPRSPSTKATWSPRKAASPAISSISREKQRDYRPRPRQLVKTAATSVQARDLALTAAQQSAAVAGA